MCYVRRHSSAAVCLPIVLSNPSERLAGRPQFDKRANNPLVMATLPEARNRQEPLLSASILDSPSQRFFISAFYLGLWAWRLFDFSKLVPNQADSLWYFMKWVVIDGIFLYGLRGLRIPWLQWSSSTTAFLFVMHVLINSVLMFRIFVRAIRCMSWQTVAYEGPRYRLKCGMLRCSRPFINEK